MKWMKTQREASIQSSGWAWVVLKEKSGWVRRSQFVVVGRWKCCVLSFFYEFPQEKYSHLFIKNIYTSKVECVIAK